MQLGSEQRVDLKEVSLIIERIEQPFVHYEHPFAGDDLLVPVSVAKQGSSSRNRVYGTETIIVTTRMPNHPATTDPITKVI